MQGAGTITRRMLTLGEVAAQTKTYDGEDMSVFAPGSLTFTSAVANTDTPGRYAVTGSIGGVAEGPLGNYRITQAAGNAHAFIVHVAPPV